MSTSEVKPVELSGVSLVIPAFNEERRIRPTLERYSRTLEAVSPTFEIIVVADGGDRTAAIANEFAQAHVKTLEESRKLGKGGAILKGFRLATFPIVGYADADGSLSDRDIETLIRTAARDGCAIASRRSPGSVWIRNSSWGHTVASRVYNILVRGVLGVPVSDTQCGAKFYARDELKLVLDHVRVTNMTVDTAILFHLRRRGKRITEVPVTWIDVAGSRYTLGSEVPVMFVTLLGIRFMNLGTRRRKPGRFITYLSRRYESI